VRPARPAWPTRSSSAAGVAPKPPRVVGPLPLPSGPGRFTVEPDGTLIFADGSCLAVVRVDAFLNLRSLGAHDQERVCREFAALVHGLVQAQSLQAIIESNPVRPDAVIDAVSATVTTPDPTLRGIAAPTLAWLEREVARTHVPDLAGYLIVAPAPEARGGLAGVLDEVRDQLGLRRGSDDARIDRHGLDAAVDDTLAQVKASDLAGRRLRRADVLALLWRTANPGAVQPDELAAACDDGALAAALTPRHWQERRREIAHTTAASADTAEDGTTVYTRSLYLLTPKDLTSPGYLGDLIAIECNARLSWHLRGLDNLRERGRVLRKRKASCHLARFMAPKLARSVAPCPDHFTGQNSPSVK